MTWITPVFRLGPFFTLKTWGKKITDKWLMCFRNITPFRFTWSWKKDMTYMIHPKMLKGETALYAISLSDVDGSYCTFWFLVSALSTQILCACVAFFPSELISCSCFMISHAVYSNLPCLLWNNPEALWFLVHLWPWTAAILLVFTDWSKRDVIPSLTSHPRWLEICHYVVHLWCVHALLPSRDAPGYCRALCEIHQGFYRA